MDTPLCEAKAVSMEFVSPEGKALHVLENVDLQVYPEEILAIIGPSGCGKSTLMRILIGLIPPKEGHIFYHGEEIDGLLPNFSLVFQNFALYPWMTVAQNIEMVLKAMDMPEEEIKKRSHEVISMIGLIGFEDAYPRELSGGMKQRVGLARAVVRDPELLVLDEPFSSLDTFTEEVLREDLLQIWKNKGMSLSSIVLISHDVMEVAFLADRIIVMGTSPGHIRFIKENKLPRPRDYHSPEFLKFVDELHHDYSQETTPKAPAPSLPHVTPEEILGFLTYIRSCGGSKELYKIAVGRVDKFNRVVMRASAADLLKFVEIADRVVLLTAVGKKYLSAYDRNRRAVWKEQILTLPLFSKVVSWLKSAPKHSLSHKELIDLISKEHSAKDPQEQCKTLIIWGCYGGLFVYHKKNRSLTLK